MKTKQTHSYWQQHISQWQKSGVSQAKYCKQHGLKANRFSYHKLKFKFKDKPAQISSSAFIKIPIAQVAVKETQAPLTLNFASGLSLSGIEANNIGLVKQLAAVLS
jgi:hypothetical protein